MGLTVRVNGVAITGGSHGVVRGTFVLTNALGQRDTLQMSIASDDDSYRPPRGAAIEVEHSSLGLLFGGTIRELSTSLYDQGSVHRLGCASLEQIFDRRLVGKRTFVDEAAGDVAQTLFDDYLGAEALTATIVETGPNITVDFDFCSIREAYDKICELASDADNTYMWDCTPAGVTRFYRQDSFPASFDLTNATGHIRRPIGVSDSFGSYGNKAFVRLPNYVRDASANTFTLDGSTRSIAYEIPIAREPSLTIDGIPQTLGVKDKDTGKDWYWQDGSPEVVQDAGGTTPAAGAVAILTAQGYQSTVIDAGQNDDEVADRAAAEGGSGLYMVLVENQTPGTSADAVAVGQAWLAKFSKVPKAVEYTTDYYGDLKAGQYQRIALTGGGLSFDETFIIESVTLSEDQQGDWTWKVRAVSGALAGQWMSKLRQIAGGSGGLAGASGGGSNSGAGRLDSLLVTVLPDGSGNVIFDLGAGYRSFRLVLDGTSLTIQPPTFTGGTIEAGVRIYVYLEQDSTGGWDPPTYTPGAGAFAADDSLGQVDGRPSIRTYQQFTYHASDDRWGLDAFRMGIAIS